MISNLFLFIPVIISAWKGEWIYFLIALGASIFSPLYHYLKIYRVESNFFKPIKEMDWVFATLSYTYMFYFIFKKVPSEFQIALTVLLSITILFFWYGFKKGNYMKFHPWFHIFASLVSGLIVFMGI